MARERVPRQRAQSVDYGLDDSSSLALHLKDVQKFHGIGRGANHVLNAFTMKVPYGTIYGLLGASGCGKTTVIRCALGRLPILSGEVYILGKLPGTPGHGVPGKNVGYMPQEEALAAEFTIKETMYYFGIIFEMKFQYVRKRAEFLKQFLDLPSLDQMCGTLSGGEKRRVSLAAALLHEPPLLILDEPTAGIDALLRARIWNHMLEITSAGNTTIIMTTHYIEEARQAHLIGLMRHGKMLAQDKPDDLIQRNNALSLEDVFLKLSEQQESELHKSVTKGASIQQVNKNEDSESTPLLSKAVVVTPPYIPTLHCGIPKFPKISRIAALTWKEVLKFVRRPVTFLFVIVNPIIQLLILAITYGTDLHDIKVYYTNNDNSYYSDLYRANFSLGKSFFDHINHDTLDLKLASSREEGIEKVEDGDAWAYFDIPGNYSRSYVKRLHNVCTSVIDGQPPNSSLSGAAIELIIDVTSQQITFAINDALNKAAELMRMDFVEQTEFCDSYFDPPIKTDKYVYGRANLKVTDSFVPKTVAGIGMAVAIVLTALNVILERKSGLYDRSWAAGVTAVEVITSQVITYWTISCIQASMLVVFGIYVVDVEREGNVLLAFGLVCVAGLAGVSLGLALSAYFGTEDAAMQAALGLVYPLYITGGIYWPVQSFDKWGRITTRLGPVTYNIESFRAIIAKGLRIEDDPVYYGFIAPVVWAVIFLTVASLMIHIKNF